MAGSLRSLGCGAGDVNPPVPLRHEQATPKDQAGAGPTTTLPAPRTAGWPMLLGIGNRIYATSQARQEGPDSEDDQDAIDGGDGQEEGD